MYNMTGFENSNNILDSTIAINSASNNLLAMSFLVVLFLVLLIRLMRNNPGPEAFTTASLVCTLICLMFLAAGLVDYKWLIGFTLMTAIGAVGIYLRNKSG